MNSRISAPTLRIGPGSVSDSRRIRFINGMRTPGEDIRHVRNECAMSGRCAPICRTVVVQRICGRCLQRTRADQRARYQCVARRGDAGRGDRRCRRDSDVSASQGFCARYTGQKKPTKSILANSRLRVVVRTRDTAKASKKSDSSPTCTPVTTGRVFLVDDRLGSRVRSYGTSNEKPQYRTCPI